MYLPLAAALYARISSDPSGTGLGVARQLEDCQRLAKSRGWTIAEEYVDNDVSAYSGVDRPEYTRMMRDIELGLRDAVIVYNIDRLTRRPRELEDFVELAERVQLTTLATVTGDFDLGNDQGLFVARMMSAVAAQESARKSARLRRKMRERAENGLPGSSGGRRAFGWAEDRVTVIPAEAELIRELATRYVAGESAGSMAADLNGRALVTVTGGPWSAASIRTILGNRRLAGWRTHGGEVVARGVWPPIISDEMSDRIRSLMESRKVAQERAPRTALLSRIARCGLCGHRLISSRHNGKRRYACRSGPGIPGCGRMAMLAEPLEAIVAEAVLTRLDSPELAVALSSAGDNVEGADSLRTALSNDRTRMDELVKLWTDGEISSAEWKIARDRLEGRMQNNERMLSKLTGHSNVVALAGSGSELREAWASLNLTRQAAIVRTIVESVTVLPAASRGSRDYLSRIRPVWRL